MLVSQPVEFATLLFQSFAAGTFFWAGAWKLAAPRSIQATLEILGLPGGAGLAASLGAVEIIAAVTMIVLPGSWVPAALIIALAGIFGSAAVVALRRRLQVDCACFGPLASGELGWRQIALVPLWILVAASLLTIAPALPEDRPEIVGVILAAVIAVALVILVPLYREHRAQRVATEGS